MTEQAGSSTADLPRVAVPYRVVQPAAMPTGEQIRAARALLRWSAAQLARAAGVSWRSVQRAESAVGVPRMHTATLDAIRRALDAEGIEFLQNSNGQGVRLRRR
jgi:transcriptional regulator with XRE-family HTH domain